MNPRGGRPSLLTPELIAEVATFLPRALYTSTVCGVLGISRQSWYYWMRRGEKESRRLERRPDAVPRESEAIYLEFFVAVRRSLAEAAIEAVAVIREAAHTHWQAAAWLLERRYPERWSIQRRELIKLRREMKELRDRLTR